MSDRFLNDLNEASLSRDGSFLVATTDNSAAGRDILDSIYDRFRELGYREPGRKRETADGKLALQIDSESRYWEGGFFLGFSKKEFWERFKTADSLPDRFFVLEENILYPAESNAFLIKMRSFLQWRKCVGRLADDRKLEFKFYINTEKGLKKHFFGAEATFEDFDRCDLPPESMCTADTMLAELEKEDLHVTERKNVMRYTLSDLLDVNPGLPPVLWVASRHQTFLNKYHENYEIYTQRFTINKMLAEIDEKQNEYISKIMEGISSSQTKALAVPGALIAVGALVKSQAPLSLILVCLGLYIVYSLTKTAGDIHRETIDLLQEQYTEALKRYQGMRDDGDVASKAVSVKGSLDHLVEKARQRLNNVDNLAQYVFLAGGLFAAAHMTSLRSFLKAAEIVVDCHRFFFGRLVELAAKLFC